MQITTAGTACCLGAILGGVTLAVGGYVSAYYSTFQDGGYNCVDMTVAECARGDAFTSSFLSFPIGVLVGAVLGLLAFLLVRHLSESRPPPISKADAEDEGIWPPPPTKPAG